LARITGVEVIAALTKRMRVGSLGATAAAKAINRFEREFSNRYLLIEISPQVIQKAMDLAKAHTLRGYDAVQLASAIQANQDRISIGGSPLIFISFKRKLSKPCKKIWKKPFPQLQTKTQSNKFCLPKVLSAKSRRVRPTMRKKPLLPLKWTANRSPKQFWRNANKCRHFILTAVLWSNDIPEKSAQIGFSVLFARLPKIVCIWLGLQALKSLPRSPKECVSVR
jgi:hypothetical protein